ncbi:DUF2911 domain-containing protein [Sphingobacterium yanglingense]|uniref:DUF2911 family protein n=1 Tax=Sphingobacterium yanglingense TaxID=1437280 RepID=A0A4R6WBZ6_9SPHI|nr:DUF2911 domain-containing protein [Sphingobacterium yanglingense]TDQ75339.1 Protein of unknown function (DUF2911) [Sphingobacterium yanglingense]
MNKIILSIATAALLFLGVEQSTAQVKLPPSSSSQTITQGLGIKDIVLSYQRPNKNNRVIFGGLVPYGEVWRTGANNIPSITFAEEVSIEGNKVPAGTYGLFTIPNKNEWTIILSKNVKQWGAYQYKKEEDLLRFNVKPQVLTNNVETFTIAFEDVTVKSAKITLAWEKTKVGFNITTDQSKEILANIDQAMLGENKPYLHAAQYYLNNGLDINKAVEWIKKGDEGNTSAPHLKYWKAKILDKAGDKAGARKAAQEGIEMATKLNNPEYVKMNTEALKAIK